MICPHCNTKINEGANWHRKMCRRCYNLNERKRKAGDPTETATRPIKTVRVECCHDCGAPITPDNRSYVYKRCKFCQAEFVRAKNRSFRERRSSPAGARITAQPTGFSIYNPYW